MPQTAKMDINKEIERRKAAQVSLQTRLDCEELERRESDAESGRSCLIAAEAFWGNVKKAGF